MQQPPPTTTLFPYTTLFRSFPKKNEAENEGKRKRRIRQDAQRHMQRKNDTAHRGRRKPVRRSQMRSQKEQDRKSTRLNSSHTVISYAVFCLKKKKKKKENKD